MLSMTERPIRLQYRASSCIEAAKHNKDAKARLDRFLEAPDGDWSLRKGYFSGRYFSAAAQECSGIAGTFVYFVGWRALLHQRLPPVASLLFSQYDLLTGIFQACSRGERITDWM